KKLIDDLIKSNVEFGEIERARYILAKVNNETALMQIAAEKAKQIDSQSWINRLNVLGLFYYINKNYNEAESLYKKALEVKPDSPRFLLNNFALVLNRTGKTEEAIQVYEKILTNNPDFIPAYNNLI